MPIKDSPLPTHFLIGQIEGVLKFSYADDSFKLAQIARFIEEYERDRARRIKEERVCTHKGADMESCQCACKTCGLIECECCSRCGQPECDCAEDRHASYCVCADCSQAELTARND